MWTETDNRYLLALVFAVLACCSGCGRQHVKINTTPTQDRHATEPMPVEVAKPDIAPVTQDMSGAAADVQVAQTGAAQLFQAAQAKGETGAASALQAILNALTSAAGKLADGTAQAKKTQDDIDAKEKYIVDLKAVHAKDAAAYQKEAKDYAAKVDKNTAVLQAQIAELRDEQLNRAKTILLWAGIACLLGGAGAIAAEFGLGFLGGFKVAVIAWPVGGVLITLSMNLNKVVWYCELGTALAVGAVVLWALYHAFKHTPTPKAVQP